MEGLIGGGVRTEKLHLVLELVVPLLESVDLGLEIREVSVALGLHALRCPQERHGEGGGRTELQRETEIGARATRD